MNVKDNKKEVLEKIRKANQVSLEAVEINTKDVATSLSSINGISNLLFLILKHPESEKGATGKVVIKKDTLTFLLDSLDGYVSSALVDIQKVLAEFENQNNPGT